MQGNRSRDTKPEMAVRRLLHAAGLRYRVSTRPVPELRRTADLVFPRQQIAVFIDGCFWHGCEAHGAKKPVTNADYWATKRARNVDRDADTTTQLERLGWRVLRYWEHEMPEEVAAEIIAVVRSERTVWSTSWRSAVTRKPSDGHVVARWRT